MVDSMCARPQPFPLEPWLVATFPGVGAITHAPMLLPHDVRYARHFLPPPPRLQHPLRPLQMRSGLVAALRRTCFRRPSLQLSQAPLCTRSCGASTGMYRHPTVPTRPGNGAGAPVPPPQARVVAVANPGMHTNQAEHGGAVVVTWVDLDTPQAV